MPIQGNIEEAGVPDVLQLLSLGRKTGCLTLEDGDTQGQIYLDVGRISYATVANRLDRLGDMLVRSGRITQQQLSAAVEEQGRSSKRQLGRILVDSGTIDRSELERFIRLQVEQAVYYLFTWKQGTFSFAADRTPPHQPLLVSLDAEGLLLEGARRVDEWSLIQKKIPSFDLVYHSTRERLGSSADGLTEEQKTILPLLDGSRDVAGIIDVTAMNEFDVGKALYGLLTAGFVQLVERRARIRHLDYRDLLAYVVREAEFADPQRRKEAARHIVDCATCAERLRTIHVRHSPGSGIVAISAGEAFGGAAAATPAAPALTLRGQAVPAAASSAPAPAPPIRQPRLVPLDAAATAPAAQPTAPATPAGHATSAPPQAPAPAPQHAGAEKPVFVDRRSVERRTGRDRRAFDRRTGIDRRQAVGLSAGPPGKERRKGPRRDEDRRGGASRARRSSDAVQRPVTPTPPASTPVRATEPRRVLTHEQLGEAEIDAMIAGDLAASETTTAAQLLGLAPEPEAAAPTPEAPPADAPASSGAAAVSSPPGGETGAPDLKWLVSPHESLEMIRANQAQLRANASAKSSPSSPAAAAKPGPERRATVSGSAATAGGAPRTEPRRLERFRAGVAEARTPGGEKGSTPGPVRQAFPLRSLAVAAVIACVALLGYMAGELGRQGRADRTGESSEATTLAPTAAQAQPRAGARTAEVRGQPDGQTPPVTAMPPAAPPAPERAARPAPDPRAAAETHTRAATPVHVATAAPPPAPTVGVIRGVVHDAAGGTVAGARVSVRGTALSAVADGSGSFEIRDVPEGALALQASADGYVAASAQARATAGTSVTADVTLNRVPAPPPVAAAPAVAASEPDRELAAGGWATVDRAEATSILGGTLGAIAGLTIESISQSTSGARARVRLAQLTPSGERIVLTETRAGARVRGGSGPAVVTALRLMPASEAYPWCTGTASLGNILVTVKTKLSADSLRPLLNRLGEVPGT